MSQRLLLYSDGGARGNPGPAAAAFVAMDGKGTIVKAESRFIGNRTNNQAEYEALLLALKFAVYQNTSEVICHLDSELVAKQLNGQYAVKNPELQELNRQVQVLNGCFRKISFVNVPREHSQIQKADALVNKTLDEEARKRLEPKNNSSSAQKKSEAEAVFVHASIRTSNMQRSIDFYERFFGLRVQSLLELKETNAQIVFLQDKACKGCILELTFLRSQTKFTQPRFEERLFDHLGFEVADINKSLGAMYKAGVTISGEPLKLNANTTIAFIEDPDGIRIELIERK